MERIQGLRGARFMFVVTLLLGSNLLTFMYSTNFYTNRCVHAVRNIATTGVMDPAETPPELSSHDADYESRELASLYENNNIASLNHRYSHNMEATRAPIISTRIIPAESRELPSIDRSDCALCQCNNTITVFVSPNGNNPSNHDQSPNQRINSNDPNMKTIFVITPTYQRKTQKIDLTAMCHTLMLVPEVVWIVIEDAPKPTSLVTQLLSRCQVKKVHLTVPTSPAFRPKNGASAKSVSRGVEQRNAGLSWLRQHYKTANCNGVVYFGDDDNKYDLRLFDDIRHTELVSVWKVAWARGIEWEGPTCKDGRPTSWVICFGDKRAFPLDMAGFAVNLCAILKRPNAKIGVTVRGNTSKRGSLESDFLQHFVKRSRAECRGSETEAYVWHSHTKSPNFGSQKHIKSTITVTIET